MKSRGAVVGPWGRGVAGWGRRRGPRGPMGPLGPMPPRSPYIVFYLTIVKLLYIFGVLVVLFSLQAVTEVSVENLSALLSGTLQTTSALELTMCYEEPPM